MKLLSEASKLYVEVTEPQDSPEARKIAAALVKVFPGVEVYVTYGERDSVRGEPRRGVNWNGFRALVATTIAVVRST